MRASSRWSIFLLLRVIVNCLLVGWLLAGNRASAEWRMEIESKTVQPGDTGVTLNVKYSWDISIVQATLPVVARTVSGGAFWTGSPPFDTTDFDGTHFVNNVQWGTGVEAWANIIHEVRMGNGCAGAGMPYNGTSPDNFAISVQGFGTFSAKQNFTFLIIEFDVNGNAGQFEFDTACFSGTLFKIIMNDRSFPVPIDHGPPPGGNGDVIFKRGIVTIGGAQNNPPILWTFGPKSVVAGENLNFDISTMDPDGATPGLLAENIPTNATFTDNGDSTGTFDFNPDFTQAGVYNVRFIASDGELADTELVAITVTPPPNQAPILAAIGSKSVTEGQILSFGVSATDPEGKRLTLWVSSRPTNTTFYDNGDGTGTFTFTPSFTQAGGYNVTFIASDGALADTEVVTITVIEAGNQAPTLAPIGPRTVTEGQSLSFLVVANDPDGTFPVLSTVNLPTYATFADSGNGTGKFEFHPDATQVGVHYVTFIASDGILADTEIVAITVQNSTGILTETADVPAEYSLSQNHPNPFNASTLIEFSLRESGPVTLDIFDILGRKIATLIDEFMPAGLSNVAWNGLNDNGLPVASGMYFYRLTAGTLSQTRKMVLMK